MDWANWALAKYLAKTGHPVHAVAYRAAEDLLATPNVAFHRVPKPLNAYAVAAPLLAARGFVSGARMAREHGCVIVNGGNCPLPAANWVHYVHAAYLPSSSARGWRAAKARAAYRLSATAERVALRMAKVVFANSERTRRHVIDRLGVAEDRAHTVYYGVDAQRFRPPTADERSQARAALGWADDRPRIVFVG